MIDPEEVEIEDYLDNCPSGYVHKFELFYPAGRQDLIRCLTAEPPEIEGTEMVRKAIQTCTGCGNCQRICNLQKGLEPTNAFQSLKQFAIDKWGIKNEHNSLIQSIINYNNPWMAPRKTRDRWSRKLDFNIRNALKEKVEVLYYPGCNASYVPEIAPTARATARLLNEAGIDFGILGDKELCCGSIAFRVGANEMFEEYKLQNIKQLNTLGIKIMVTACAGCYSTYSHNYANELDFEVIHVVEYIQRLIEEGKLKFKKPLNLKATYHDPCHIGRYCGIYDAPREILKSIPGVSFNEMRRIRENSFCCGSGGGVKPAFPEMALKAANHRLDEARDTTNSEVIVSCCPFCEINLGEAAMARSDNIRVADLIELIDEAVNI
jgi:Fe-S oxidoreductase